MQTIVLIMRRRPVAQAFIKKLENNADVSAVFEPDYARAGRTIRQNNAAATLIEVGETDGYGAAFCLDLCGQLRKGTPSCRLVLMCPEQNESSILQAVKAKKCGQIDDFVFYDASLEYLTSKLLSML